MGATRGRNPRLARLAVAALVAVSGLLGAVPSSAEPTQADLEAAEARLEELNEHQSLLVEEYNQAQLAKKEAEAKLGEAQRDLARARDDARAARDDLQERVVAVYTGMGTEIDLLLGAESFGEFSDRLEFLGQLAEHDQSLALEAEAAGQRATWASERLEEAVREREQALATIDRKTDEIEESIAEQERTVAELEDELERLRELREQQATVPPVGDIGSDISPPPAPSPRAQAAIDAAFSVIGTPYQWGGSDPQTGFDCSGLTMWAWAHAGVSLPHSSSAQYSMLPKVPRDQLQPGDLVFFYSPIHHVGIYIGGGRMIDSPHTGTVVQVRPVNWDSYVGAGRPG